MKKDFPILVVDDDVVSRTVVEMHLLKAGFTVLTAANGSNALEQFDQQFFPIVLTDWMMPEIDGPQLCRLIREKKTDGYVFIILITARDSKTDIVSGLESGADDYLTKPIHSAELIARINTGIRILKLEQSLKKANEEIRLLSITDPLTGCYNRSYLNEHLPHELRRAQRYSHQLSVILADIDHFKKVNDTYGHQAGDDVLKAFSRCIGRQVRKKIDWVVRYGGEEFMIVLPETNCFGADSMANRLRCAVEKKKISFGDAAIQITASFGGTCVAFEDKSMDDVTMDQLIYRADEKLYQSKENGRNQVNIVEFTSGS
ncbi:MAG: diguanylate cyclase [Desulfobacteraceae bacterium]|jgi:diguanylate cyclase (GGDEF)-like protein